MIHNFFSFLLCTPLFSDFFCENESLCLRTNSSTKITQSANHVESKKIRESMIVVNHWQIVCPFEKTGSSTLCIKKVCTEGMQFSVCSIVWRFFFNRSIYHWKNLFSKGLMQIGSGSHILMKSTLMMV